MSRRNAGGEDVGDAPPWGWEIRDSDYELSALGQDVDASGRVEKALAEAVGSLLLVVALMLGTWVVWSR
jgi:hypothetical protein